MFRRIFVASDLSDASRPAVRMALQLGSQLGASVVALHVIEDEARGPKGHQDGLHSIASRNDDGRLEEHAARLRLERQTRGELGGGRSLLLESIVRSGPIAATIVGTAEAGEADLLIVGAGQRAGSLGSIAAQVVGLSGRPVLAVPPEGSEHDESRGTTAPGREVHDPRSAHDRVQADALGRS